MNLVTAHQSVQCPRIKRVSKQSVIIFEFILPLQIAAKLTDWHVRNGQQTGKFDPESLPQFMLIIRLKFEGIWRERAVYRIIDEIQGQVSDFAVSAAVEYS